jgi:hypothetical protein
MIQTRDKTRHEMFNESGISNVLRDRREATTMVLAM